MNLNRSERILNLLYMIHRNPGIQCNDLAEYFGTSLRTIQRDLKQVRKLGFSIKSSTGAAGGFVASGGYFLRPLTFTGIEALALFISARALLEQKEFPYRDNLQSALKKIAGVVNEKEERFLEDLEPNISLEITGLMDNSHAGESFLVINKAILNSARLAVNYNSYSGNEVKVRLVDPYHVMFREGFWYLVGYCHARHETRIFRIDRIVDVSITEEKFKLPEGFNVKDFMGNSWRVGKGDRIEISVKFYPPVSRLIQEGVWHATQRLEETPDGGLIFKAEVEGVWEIKKWILSWGPAAEVLEPEALREEIRKELNDMLQKYGMPHSS